MNLERALSYSNSYKKIKKISPYLICFVVLIICVLIHIPSDLAHDYVSNDQLYVQLRLCYNTKFTTEPITKMILIVSYIIEGPVVMILIIGTNILAYKSYKLFIKRKQETTMAIHRVMELTASEKRKQAKIEKMNKKLLKMTIYLSFFSIISHLIQFGTQLILFVFNSHVSLFTFILINFIFSFIIFLKHFFTIFFYYHFNLNFKNSLIISIRYNKLRTIENLQANNIAMNFLR